MPIDISLPLARYRFTAQVLQPLALPEYAGSLLRGQFGAALRSVACMTRQPTCANCPLLRTCPYTRIFEAPPPEKGQHRLQDFSQIPNPYVMEPPSQGARILDINEELVFHLVLVGQALEQLALVVFALQRALAQGLTRQRVPLELRLVEWLDEQGTPHAVWNHDRQVLADHPTWLQLPAVPAVTDSITLHIHTPLRLQLQGKPLGVGQLTPRALVAALARRAELLMEFHAGQEGWGEDARHITHISEQLTDTRDLHWFDWTRFSSRQRQEMTLGGVVGRWSLHGSPETMATLWPWLWMGQWIHVGKNATMGLGRYSL